MAFDVGAVLSSADWLRRLIQGGQVAPPAPDAAAPTTAAPAGTEPPVSGEPTLPERAPKKPPPYPTPTSNLERMLNTLAEVEADIAYWQQVAEDPNLRSYQREDAAKKLLQYQQLRSTTNSSIGTEAARTQHPAKGTEIETVETYGGRQYRVHWKADGQGGKTLDSAKGTNGVEPMDVGAAERITANGQVYTVSPDGKTATPLSGVGPAVTVTESNGQKYVSTDQGQTWKPAQGLPATQQRIQGQDGRYYTLSPDGTTATPIGGIGGTVKVEQRGGASYISKDNGATWEPAQGLPNVPSVQTIGGRAVGIDPLTGQQTFRTDLYSPEERARAEQGAGLTLEGQRQALLPRDAVAAYTQEATRYQTLARQERDRLLEQQRQGALTADQAGQQFQQWFADQVEAPLAGLRSAAETARRQEEQQQQALQRAEDQRAEALNRQRESLGYQAGEQARGQLAQLAPQLRSPEFLRQQGQMVSAMSQRAAAPSAEAAANVPPAAFTPAAFDPAGYRAAMPDFGAYAKAATERALASISPAVAARIGAPLPQLPTGPALQSMLSGINYQGPLVRPPSGVQPLLGQEAIDLNTGMARSQYPGGTFYDWRIPQ